MLYQQVENSWETGKTNLDYYNNYKSIHLFFRDIYPDKIISAETLSYDTYFDKTQNQSPETVAVAESSDPWTSVLLNQTILENPDDFIASIGKMWIPRCYSTKGQIKP